jgi:hypothetical protein
MKVGAREQTEIYRSRWLLLCQMALFGDDAREFLSSIVTDLRASPA